MHSAQDSDLAPFYWNLSQSEIKSFLHQFIVLGDKTCFIANKLLCIQYVFAKKVSKWHNALLPTCYALNMIFNYRSIPGLMFNFVEAVLNQRLSTPFGCAGFESPILRLELNWQDLILHLPYLPLCPMTEVDHQQEVELFPPKESLQVVELSPRYVPNFNLHISYWKTVLALNKSGQIPTFCPLFVCFGPALVHF